MFYNRIRLAAICFAIAIFLLLNSKPVQAQFEPPDDITITMYHLEPGSGGLLLPLTLCTQNDRAYGCTADPIDPNRGYPFTSSVITIGMENYIENGIQQGYLHNVVPSEMNPQNRNAIALQAQAIAARTHGYFEQTYPTCPDGSEPITNSNADQVYLPFMYDLLPITPINYQLIVDQSVSNRYYMSYSQNINACGTTIATDQPIFSEFSADAYIATIDHPEQSKYPYMQGVADPISNHPEVPALVEVTNSHQRGFSQNGASRWANGNLTSNPAGDKGAWSVRWGEPHQILTHYYTGIHIRDANAVNNVVKTPERRWVPLSIFGLSNPDQSRTLCKNRTNGFVVEVQNTGILAWGPDSFELSYRPSWSATSDQTVNTANLLPAVDPGASTSRYVTIEVPGYVVPGPYTIELDMRVLVNQSDYEWFSDDGWYRYPINVAVVEDCQQLFLPIVQYEVTVPVSQ